VPGRGTSQQAASEEVELVAIDRTVVREAVATLRRRHDARAVASSQLARSREVVVVHVRLERVRDAPATRLGDLGDAPRVARHIDGDGPVAMADEVGLVAQAGGGNGHDLRRHGAGAAHQRRLPHASTGDTCGRQLGPP
jgi:hypothetical protein